MNLENITTKQLLDPNTWPEIRKSVDFNREEKFYADLYAFFLILKNFLQTSGDLESQQRELFTNYHRLYDEIEVATFSVQPREIQIEILKKRFRNFALYHVDLAEQLDRAIFYEFQTLRDDLKEEYIGALIANSEPLGTGHVTVNNKQLRASIGSWLQKYIEVYGPERRSNVEQTEFVMRNDEVASFLNENEQKELLDLLALFDSLRPSHDELLERNRLRHAEESVQRQQLAEEKLTLQRRKRVQVQAQQLAQEIRTTGTLPSAVSAVPPTAAVPAAPRRSLSRMGIFRKKVDAMATPQPAQSQPTSPAQPRGFHSLVDLPQVDRALVETLGATIPQFAQVVKGEVAKVYGRSPQSKGEIVNLWRNSPLYRLYMEIGQESMRTQKTVQQLSQERAKRGLPVLSKDEFDAIADLSRTIQQ